MHQLRDRRVRLVMTDERLVSTIVGTLVGWNETFLFIVDDDGDYIGLNQRYIGAISAISDTNP